jgi:DNA topoisomerase-1
LRDFWRDFTGAVDGTHKLRVRDVLDSLNEILADHVFRAAAPGKDPRQCPACAVGKLSLKVGRFGAFVGCSNYPECKYTRRLADGGNGEADAGPRELGKEPASGATVSVRKGPYGHYIQRDALAGEEKPKRVSIPKGVAPAELGLERALQFLALPREVGKHPETGKKISAGIGRFGPYVRHDADYRSLAADEDVLTVGLNRAVALLAEPKQQRRGPAILRSLGAHPADGKAVNIHEGRYGAYVAHNGVNATLPAGIEPYSLSIDAAVTLLAERARRSTKRRGRAVPAKGRRTPAAGDAPGATSTSKKRSKKKAAASD